MKKTDYLLPPQDLAIEEVVLGALLLVPKAIKLVESILKSESFYRENHGLVYSAIKFLADASHPIDILTVTKALRDKGQLDAIGGPLFVTQLASRVGSAGHIEYHASIIQELYLKRELIRAGRNFIDSLYDEIEIDAAVDSLRSGIDNILNSTGAALGKNSPQIISEALAEITEAITTHKSGGLAGISTGFKKLDLVTGGWRKGILAVVAARTGIGKTSLAMHFLKEAIKLNKHVVLYSYEMTAAKLGQFMICALSGVDRTVLRDGWVNENEWEEVKNAADVLMAQKIRIIDSGSSTIDQIKVDVARSVNRNQCDLVIVDYIGLVRTSSNRYLSNADRIAEISGILKQIAMSNNIPVLCLAQLNREAEKFEEPQLHHLRDSGAIEQDADLVLMPYYDEKTGARQFKLKIAKNRDGGAGDSIAIYPNDQFNVFTDQNPMQNNGYINPNQRIESENRLF
jgi:replicative DNA helicase